MSNLKYILAIGFVVGLFMALTLRAVPGVPTQNNILTNLKEPTQPFESSQERAKYGLAANLAEKQEIQVDNYAEISLPDISYKDGHYYVALPGTPFIVAPAYYLGSLIGHPVIATFAMVSLFAVLTSIMIFLAARRLGLGNVSSFLAAIIFSLTTIAWSYSVSLYAHIFSAFCLSTSLYFALRGRTGSVWNYFGTWFFYGVSITIDYPNAFIMLPIILLSVADCFHCIKVPFRNVYTYVLNLRPLFILTILPFLGLIFLLGWYNQTAFGFWGELGNNLRVTSLVTGSPIYNYASISQTMNMKFLENGFYTLLFSMGRGIMVFSPIVLLSVWGIEKLFAKLPRITFFLTLVFVANLIIYSFFYDPWGGWSYGPRYLIVSMHVISLFLAQSYESFKHRSMFLIIFAALFFASFAIASLGALTTNLLPPSAESGTQISFLQNISYILQNKTGSLAFNNLNHYLPFVSLLDYYIGIVAIGGAFIMPIFLYQLGVNVSRIEVPRMVKLRIKQVGG